MKDYYNAVVGSVPGSVHEMKVFLFCFFLLFFATKSNPNEKSEEVLT